MTSRVQSQHEPEESWTAGICFFSDAQLCRDGEVLRKVCEGSKLGGNWHKLRLALDFYCKVCFASNDVVLLPVCNTLRTVGEETVVPHLNVQL
jgi:hypothetical protein